MTTAKQEAQWISSLCTRSSFSEKDLKNIGKELATAFNEKDRKIAKLERKLRNVQK